ncbi:NrsF family protein [Novosphingobium sp. BL-8H]|uniref:DUF1109 domain-containing protein n=1 Tax=Novosphingobium sp. BL-8H TaxID=3127640 RepID=UPI0037568DCE
MRDHEPLIDALAGGMQPVRRVAPAWLRALGWAPVALALGYLSTSILLHRQATDWVGGYAAISAANVVLSLALGITAFAAALSVSVAGGRIVAKGWMALGLVLWALLAAVSIALSSRPITVVVGEGSYCFTFVITAGLPMIAVALAALRRTRSLRPKQSLVAAGMAVSFLSFGLLAFCHPAEMSVADFLMHLLAALALGAVFLVVGRPAIRI